MLLVAETFVADEQAAADPIQRIVAPTTMTERLLLHTTAGIVDRRVREPDRVEVIDHDRRVKPVSQPVGAENSSGSLTCGFARAARMV
jgi:hypothetical protein